MTEAMTFTPLTRSEALSARVSLARQQAPQLARWALRRPMNRTKQLVSDVYEDQRRTEEWQLLGADQLVTDGKGLGRMKRRDFLLQYVSIIKQAIAHSGAASVLEVGCGEGINVALMAESERDTFSKAAWHAFDYSHERAGRAKRLHDSLRLGVHTWQDDAETFSQQVDLIYTVHVLEQMPQGWRKALYNFRENAWWYLMIEPVYERKSLRGKLHSTSLDYFRASIREIERMGFMLEREYPVQYSSPLNRSTALLFRAN